MSIIKLNNRATDQSVLDCYQGRLTSMIYNLFFIGDFFETMHCLSLVYVFRGGLKYMT